MKESKVEIIVSLNNKEYQIDKKIIQDIAFSVFKHLHLDFVELSVQFVDNEEIRTINQRYRGVDTVTDVLSFPQNDWLQKPSLERGGTVNSLIGEGLIRRHLGDIVISPESALKNANNIGQKLDREICFLLIHGILHLCGYDHQNSRDEQVMLKQQRALMDSFMRLRPLWCGCVNFFESNS